jgi:DNA-directed RNA polymerase specialized sigma24 family protein
LLTRQPIEPNKILAMSSEGTITYWIGRLKAGDRNVAVRRLWEAYREELLRVARARLRDLPRRAADEEDVLQNAFDSFFHDIDRQRYAKLDDRDDLWQILIMLITDKAHDLIKHARRVKRGGGRVHDEQAAIADHSSVEERWVDQLAGKEPDPAVALEWAEHIEHLLGMLGSEELRFVAEWKINLCTNEEIAAGLGRTVRTVERKVQMIRALWAKELSQ